MINKRVSLQRFSVTGLSVRTANQDEFNPATAKLPDLWQRFFAEGLLHKIPNQQLNSPILGVYSNYESNADGHYTVTAGVKTSEQSNKDAFNNITILSGDYIVFENQGDMPASIIATWNAIWDYFNSQKNVVRAYKTDFEMYLKDNQIAIYIGVIE